MLDFEEAGSCFAEAGDEVGEGDLRGVGPAVEHRLAAEDAADQDAVDAADQASPSQTSRLWAWPQRWRRP